MTQATQTQLSQIQWSQTQGTRTRGRPIGRGACAGVTLAVATLSLLAACDPPANTGGVPGDEGVALFDTPTPLLFEHRSMVGSAWGVTVTARRSDDVGAVAAATLVSSDESVFTVAADDTDVELCRL